MLLSSEWLTRAPALSRSRLEAYSASSRPHHVNLCSEKNSKHSQLTDRIPNAVTRVLLTAAASEVWTCENLKRASEKREGVTALAAVQT